jgi:beta-N-acetylhexosaminidase
LYTIPVANNLFMNKHYIDTMWFKINNSQLKAKKYEYSDLDFLYLQKLVEKVSGKPLDVYMNDVFYKPLGLKNTCYKPLANGKKLADIAPTEQDDYFRYQLVHGYVHDMAAAMLGGVAGHAGLFSTADDISILLQMLLNGGVYKNSRYLKAETIELFTTYGSANSRRGLGWDKPEKNISKDHNTADACSRKTYGHTGFTGTCVWADPDNNIQFIFLSNRTMTTTDTNLLAKKGIRTKVHQLIYESLGY